MEMSERDAEMEAELAHYMFEYEDDEHLLHDLVEEEQLHGYYSDEHEDNETEKQI